MMERYLVTGAQGFVGSHFVREALSYESVTVLGLGRGTPLPLAGVDSRVLCRYSYARADLLDTATLARLIRQFEPTTIVHLASALRDDPPQQLLQTNVAGMLSLLEAIERAAVPPPRLLVGSSGGVYGRSTHLPLAEDEACAPIDFYSASKLAQEHAARIVGASRGLDVVVARLFNLIGPGQDERHACARFARQLVEAAQLGTSIEINVGDLQPTRDFIDVRDVAAALLLLVGSGRPDEIYNVASGVETSMEALLQSTCEAVGLFEWPQLLRTYHRAAEIPRHVADVTKLRSLGYRSRYDLAASVSNLVAYYQATLQPAIDADVENNLTEKAARCG